MFTLRKEEEMKARGVEMITRDRTYDPQKEQAAGYKPKVSTWGVFPRPQDISKAYGGGRTIQPADVRPICHLFAKAEGVQISVDTKRHFSSLNTFLITATRLDDIHTYIMSKINHGLSTVSRVHALSTGIACQSHSTGR